MIDYKSWIEPIKSTVDWFVEKDPKIKLTIVFMAILSFFIYHYVVNEQERNIEIDLKIKSLETLVQNCATIQEQNNHLKQNITELKISNIMLKASSDYLPFPFWIKDTRGTMIYLNNAYERKYLLPRGLTATDYLNKNDTELWSASVAKKFKTSDSIVMATGVPLTVQELDNQIFTKFTVKVGEYVVGVGGVEYVYYK